jgi:hypothetical protein
MKNHIIFYSSSNFICSRKATTVTSKQSGKYDTNKFSQMYDLLATPNMFRNAVGAPGPAYYQQADYKIDIELDDKNAKLNGSETVTYYNNLII